MKKVVEQSEQRLHAHLNKQAELAKTISARFDALDKKTSTKDYILLKDNLKKMLIEKSKTHPKLVLTLVDIQNDFVLKDFALYAQGGENTVVSNMALLDAVLELEGTNPKVYEKIEIVTSQDAHVAGRTLENNTDARIMRDSSFGLEKTKAAIAKEQKELQGPIDPSKEQYDYHCLTGTIGAAISRPIQERLDILKALGTKVTQFGKINFSGPDAGMRLIDGIQLSDTQYFGPAGSIYHASGETYLDYFTKKCNDALILGTGICGNVCVQQALEGLAAAGLNVEGIDACIHYLTVDVVPSMKYDQVIHNVLASYKQKGVAYIFDKNFRSNPESISYVSAGKTFKLAIMDQLYTAKFVEHHQHLKQALADQTFFGMKFVNDHKVIKALDHKLDQATRALLLSGDYKAFKAVCFCAIDEARTSAENPRWVQFLVNLASAIVSVVMLGMANLFSGRGFFGLFHTKTAWEEMKDALKTTVSDIARHPVKSEKAEEAAALFK